MTILFFEMAKNLCELSEWHLLIFLLITMATGIVIGYNLKSKKEEPQ